MTICSIHQPNFFPWAGYFDKIKKADVFIFLDEVAYPKSGSGSGSWCNRVKLLNGGRPSWYGLPIVRESGVQLIKDVKFINKEYHLKKILKSLEYNYKKTACYPKFMPFLEMIFSFPTDNLAEFNINAITRLADFLKLKTSFIRQSELIHSQQSTPLLIELVKQVNANTYLCGNGSSGYQQDHLFAEAGIKVCYQDTMPAKNFNLDISQEESTLSMLHHLFSYSEQLST